MTTNKPLAIHAIAALASALLLAGCKTTDEPSMPIVEPVAEPVVEEFPAGTIQTGENTYMVPLEMPDAGGCLGYRVVSPGNLTVQAIYYRTPDGDFTANKLLASCRLNTAGQKDGQ